jgi:hypothetical protein
MQWQSYSVVLIQRNRSATPVGQALMPAAVRQSPNQLDMRQPALIARRIHHPCYNLPHSDVKLPVRRGEKIDGNGCLHCAGVKA